MRKADPKIEKNFFARLMAKPILTRFGEVLEHPVRSMHKMRDRWYECKHPDHPVFVPSAIEYLAKVISKDHRGFEWGSGSSTIWFAKRCERLVSIEHSRVWYEEISHKLKCMGIDNVEYYNIDLNHAECEPTYPTYEKIPDYVAAIQNYPDASFDFCIVDGHYRQCCIVAAQPKIKPRGFLVVDDTHWMPLSQWGVAADWQIVLSSATGMKKTTIWQKPK
jgi:hypothetical protein